MIRLEKVWHRVRIFALLAVGTVGWERQAAASVTYDGVTYPTETSEATTMGYVVNAAVTAYGESHFSDKATGQNGYLWSDEEAPKAGNKYFCTATRSIQHSPTAPAAYNEYTFAGDVLVLRGSCSWKTYANACMNFATLVTVPGASFVSSEKVQGACPWLKGTLINLCCKSSYPLIIYPDHQEATNQFFILDCELKGPDTATLAVRPHVTGVARKAGGCIIRGETADYLGRITVDKNDLIVGDHGLANACGVTLTDSTLKVRATAGRTVTVSNLTLDAASAIELNVTNVLELTGSVTLADGVTFAIDSETIPDAGLTDAVLLKVPKGTAIEGLLPDVAPTGCCRTASWTCREVGDVINVELSVCPLVTLIVSDKSTDKSHDFPISSAMTNDASWTGGPKPTSGYDYYVGNKLDLATLIETGNDVTMPTFPGNSLTVGANSAFVLKQTSMRIDRLRLCPLAIFQARGGHSSYLSGNLEVLSFQANDYASYTGYWSLESYTNEINSTVSGNGSIRFIGSGGSSNPKGVVRLGGINTNWYGRSIVTIETYAAKGSPAWDKTMYLFVTNGLALGAPLATFTYNALQLEQFGAIGVQPGWDVTFDAANRGVYVKDNGQAIVQGSSTLALGNDVTYCGILHKRGSGTLALGGTARFGADGTGSPVVNSNRLDILEGTFMPTTTGCVDGVAIAFASGTGLVYDVLPDDADFASDGLVLANAASVWTSADATLPVNFVSRTALLPQTHRVALLTGTEAACTAMQARLKFVRSTALRAAHLAAVSSSVRPREDGRYTLYADIRYCGFLMNIR